MRVTDNSYFHNVTELSICKLIVIFFTRFGPLLHFRSLFFLLRFPSLLILPFTAVFFIGPFFTQGKERKNPINTKGDFVFILRR
ncbi:MAG: hypothetical protein ABS965_05295, partial [Succiniclasticum sp.]